MNRIIKKEKSIKDFLTRKQNYKYLKNNQSCDHLIMPLYNQFSLKVNASQR
jgi:hypothetical protein